MMIKKTTFVLLIAISLFSIISCENSSDNNTEEETTTDSISVEIEEVTETLPPATSPGLIGKWQLSETRMGATPMSMDIGKSILEFTDDNQLISISPNLPTETFEFYEENNKISSDLWDEKQKITSLDETELILTEIIDGEEIHYVYKKVE